MYLASGIRRFSFRFEFIWLNELVVWVDTVRNSVGTTRGSRSTDLSFRTPLLFPFFGVTILSQ